MRSTLLTLTIFLSALQVLFSQPFTTDNYYLFPINPGQQNYLAGTMGELRSSHFHAGIDIKTGGRSGLPVYATAEGYISRIKISVGGYGYALYMTHPNGTTSVYAHLSEFEPTIAAYVKEAQYREESYEIQLFPQKDLFYFRQGEVIGYSGNTGSSSGPHLHFEIRDRNQRILDPLKFNFPEIKDNIAPVLKNVAFVTLEGNARVNQTFGRFEFDVLKTNGIYKTRVPLNLTGKVGLEIYAYDLLNGVYNRNGISRTTLLVDGDTVFSQSKTNLSFSHQRSILVHMDYPRYRQGGRKFNKLFVDDGNTNDIYTVRSEGYVFDENPHVIRVLMEDSYGNISTFETRVNDRKVVNLPDPDIQKFELFRNHLHFKATHSGDPKLIKMLFGNAATELVPYRTDRRSAYYLWDLRKGLPDSVDYCGEILHTDIYASIPPRQEISFYNHHVDLNFKKYSLFDTLYLRFKKSFNPELSEEVFEFKHRRTPLRGSVNVTLKPEYAYPENTQVYAKNSNRLNFVGGNWKDQNITFTTRELGTYVLTQDTIPPEISPQIVSPQKLYFKINDDRSGVATYRATLNGQFLLMNYEYKQNMIWANPKDENIPMVGEFTLEVTDNAGNVSTYKHEL
ncbi:M23 family metallopeptidase [Marinoscillum furvescens]|uniref:Peptidase M23-like protein n=1 Tax=Marinoscillum furvescens DSM 4134 TaxID=1122208 RepID=A0A3D9L1K9_MARFU|nr:M23 family metallopeptidase [Marinoscillum furvescens]RED97479.1 peptidase M23-like protein [Marinoscillum furvescens DSM 4134]